MDTNFHLNTLIVEMKSINQYSIQIILSFVLCYRQFSETENYFRRKFIQSVECFIDILVTKL